jgi:hypothetical protein
LRIVSDCGGLVVGELLDRAGVVSGVVEVEEVVVAIQGLRLLIALVLILMLLLGGRVGRRVSGLEHWVVLQLDIRWEDVEIAESGPRSDLVVMMQAKAARGLARRHDSHLQVRAPGLDRQGAGEIRIY